MYLYNYEQKVAITAATGTGSCPRAARCVDLVVLWGGR